MIPYSQYLKDLDIDRPNATLFGREIAVKDETRVSIVLRYELPEKEAGQFLLDLCGIEQPDSEVLLKKMDAIRKIRLED